MIPRAGGNAGVQAAVGGWHLPVTVTTIQIWNPFILVTKNLTRCQNRHSIGTKLSLSMKWRETVGEWRISEEKNKYKSEGEVRMTVQELLSWKHFCTFKLTSIT